MMRLLLLGRTWGREGIDVRSEGEEASKDKREYCCVRSQDDGIKVPVVRNYILGAQAGREMGPYDQL